MNTFFQWLAEFIRGTVPWIIVVPWEVAIRIRLGKFTKLLGPGLHFRFPYFDEFLVVNTRIRIATTILQTISTKNCHAISLAASIGFRVNNPLDSFMQMQDPNNTVAAYATTLITEYILNRNLEQIIVSELRDTVLSGLKSFSAGMEFEFVSITDFAVVKTFRLLQESGRIGVWGESNKAAMDGTRTY